jgi:hypothetical protein
MSVEHLLEWETIVGDQFSHSTPIVAQYGRGATSGPRQNEAERARKRCEFLRPLGWARQDR